MKPNVKYFVENRFLSNNRSATVIDAFNENSIIAIYGNNESIENFIFYTLKSQLEVSEKIAVKAYNCEFLWDNSLTFDKEVEELDKEYLLNFTKEIPRTGLFSFMNGATPDIFKVLVIETERK